MGLAISNFSSDCDTVLQFLVLLLEHQCLNVVSGSKWLQGYETTPLPQYECDIAVHSRAKTRRKEIQEENTLVYPIAIAHARLYMRMRNRVV